MMDKNLPKSFFKSLWARPGFLVRRLHQIHVAMFLEECAPFNVTPAQFAVLSVLRDDETLDQISIAQDIGFDRNTVADVVRRLERRGLVMRPKSVKDRRAKLARITKKGIDFVDVVQPAMIKAQRRLIEPISRKEHLLLTKIMRQLIEANNDSSRAPMLPKRNGQFLK
jgi:DNA-binding MarR family transcriptional regulator